MRIFSCTDLTFKRSLRTSEEAEYSAVLKKAKEKIGNTGKSVLIIPSASLPQQVNTGVGNFLDKEGQSFLEFAKQYWGINCVQLLPEGRYEYFCGGEIYPYSGSSLDLGNHLINLESLTTENYAKILGVNDLSEVVSENRKNEINFENVINRKSKTEEVLRRAYENLLKSDSDSKKQLLKELAKFSENNNDWLEAKSIFEALTAKYNTSEMYKWSSFDRNFYNTDFVTLEDRNNAIKNIKTSQLSKEADFYIFKQFLADRHLREVKNDLNKMGIKLSGDMIIGFSKDEVWANPKAFLNNCSIHWGLPALNYDTIEGENLLRKKVELFAKRYDGIRVDASWIYCSQPVKDAISKLKYKKEYGSKIFNIIDEEVMKVKGRDFDLNNIMHEFTAKPEDFDIFDGRKLKPYVEKRVSIYTSNHMHSDWGSVNNFRKRGWNPDKFIIGTTNHDNIPMKLEFVSKQVREAQSSVLSKILKIPKPETLQDFIKAKFAEPMKAKNNMIFFADALNLDGLYKGNQDSSRDYRMRISQNWKNNYFKSLENGEGFNVMDALEKAFVSEGLDKKEKDLYKKIVKFRKILEGKESNFPIKIVAFATLGILSLASVIYLNNKSGSKKSNNNTN